MNAQQIEKFILRFCEAYQCQMISQTTSSLTYQLSPEADKALTNRPYYWNFVERTGIAPETLTLMFMFQPEAPLHELTLCPTQANRMIREDVSFGSKRLQQMFSVVQQAGRFSQLFESKENVIDHLTHAKRLETWLGLQVSVEYTCDCKRSSLFSYGIQLTTGEIKHDFFTYVQTLNLTPKLPNGFSLQAANLSIREAVECMETALEQRIRSEDHTWAEQAYHRWQQELAQIQAYYKHQLLSNSDEQIGDMQSLYDKRQAELAWQYQPRISLSVNQAGLFHLLPMR